MHWLLLLPALLAANPDAANWPGFRGHGDNVSKAANLPLTWSEKENLAWKVELPGYGQSAPVVWKERVYLTAVSGAERDKGFVLALDAKTGKEVWRHEVQPRVKAKWSATISRAAPTPAIDAAGVYAFFEGGNLLALSHEGKPLWSRSLAEDYGDFVNGHGLAASPAQTADTLFVLIDHRGPSYLLAVDKATGKNRWKADRKERSSWASPIVAGKQVVVSSGGDVVGYDITTGKELWKLDGLSGNTIPSATLAGDRLIVGAGVGRMGGDAEAATKSNCCLKLVAKEGQPGFEVLWKADKATCSYASPLVHDGLAYFVNSAGVVHCLDAATGETKYAERIEGPLWATPIGAGGHVYFFGKDGRTTVLKAGPKFEKVATNRLWDEATEKRGTGFEGGLDPVVYGVAAVDGAFFVRTGTALFRVGKP